jgi:uncharacterized repeat protein (TIGR01451 family)
MEIENDGYDANSAIQDLVDALNDSAPAGVTYNFVDPGVAQIGADEIAVGLIYRTETVELVGSAAILDSSVDPLFVDTRNRPALAQTFRETATGEKLTIAVNHLKSKGSPCDDIGDPDTGDGQGNCNLTRTDAANAEANWLATDPTGSGDPDFLIIGDLNAYAMEDPITALKNKGYTNLIQQFVGLYAYSYIFDGASGYLDHALANGNLLPQVTGATEWAINADEPSVIDYNTEYKPQDFYEPTPYRASDHDPVIVGLKLAPPDLSIDKEIDTQTGGTLNLPLGDVVTYTIVLSNSGNSDAFGVVMTDDLPDEVGFGGWVEQNGAIEANNIITWTGVVSNNSLVTFIFTATVSDSAAFYGAIVTNTAEFTSTNAGSDSDDAVFTIAEEVTTPALTIDKEIETPGGGTLNLPLSSLVTYTIILSNSGLGDALGVVMTDDLPAQVDFAGWVQQSGATEANDTIAWTGAISGGNQVTIIFTANVLTETNLFGQSVTNTAEFTSTNAGSGSDEVIFTIMARPKIYLPVVMKN